MENKKRIRLKVASPCKVDWDSMTGDDAVRFCGQCTKNVYELSNMSTSQVEELLEQADANTCVRFFQREDGTVMTTDCGPGLRRRRRKQAVLATGAGVFSAFGLALSAMVVASREHSEAPKVQVVKEPVSEEVIMGKRVMGEMVALPRDIHPPVDVQPEELEVIMGDIAVEESEE